jgi:hypothetical protein
MWLAKAFHCFPKEFHRCLAVAALRDIAFQHFALVIYGALQVVRFTVDLHKHLIQMPLPIRMSTKLLTPFLSDFSCKQWAEPVPPEVNRLMELQDILTAQRANGSNPCFGTPVIFAPNFLKSKG